MVRTKADAGCGSSRKVVAAQAPRKSLGGGAGPSTSAADGSSPAGKGKYAGGNSVCPRPTPEWQKGINSFFTKTNTSSQSGSSSGGSSSSSGGSSQEDNVSAGSSADS